MNIYYAGIGSRETPHEILDIFTQIGAFLAAHGYTFVQEPQMELITLLKRDAIWFMGRKKFIYHGKDLIIQNLHYMKYRRKLTNWQFTIIQQ